MMKEILTILTVVLVGSLSTNCNNFISSRTDSLYMDYDYEKLGYKFFEPSKKHFLNYDLEEISGLSYFKDGQLAAIEDEDGKLFIIETSSGKVTREIKFGKSGDYEGVEVLNDMVYVLRSDGDIYSFSISDKNEVDAKKYETVLESSNDAEGLGYTNGKLMVALKGDEDTDENKAKGKAVYTFDLENEKLDEKELFDIEEEELDEFIEGRKYFKKVNDFDPSAIAQHPLTNDIYLLSADRIIAVFTASYELKEVVLLPSIPFNQAEGICFAPDGTLYISSEGDGGKGKIITINYTIK